MKLENLKLSEVIKLIEDKPDEILKISTTGTPLAEFEWTDLDRFVVTPIFWVSRNCLWTVELKPIKKELTRDDLAQAWDVASNSKGFTKIKSSDDSRFFKAICERLGL